jgi:hypothetical protein
LKSSLTRKRLAKRPAVEALVYAKSRFLIAGWKIPTKSPQLPLMIRYQADDLL